MSRYPNQVAHLHNDNDLAGQLDKICDAIEQNESNVFFLFVKCLFFVFWHFLFG